MHIHASDPHAIEYDVRCPFGGHSVKNIVWVDEEGGFYGELCGDRTITKRGIVEVVPGEWFDADRARFDWETQQLINSSKTDQ